MSLGLYVYIPFAKFVVVGALLRVDRLGMLRPVNLDLLAIVVFVLLLVSHICAAAE